MKQRVSDKLATKFCGIDMRSPIGVAPMNIPRGERSAITSEIIADIFLKHVNAGAGFVYMPCVDYITQELIDELKPRAAPINAEPKPQGARFMRLKTPSYGVNGLLHLGMTTLVSAKANIDVFELIRKTLEIVKKGLPEGVPIVAVSSPLGDFAESAVVSAKNAEEIGVDILELNFGCGLTTAIEGAVDFYLNKKFPLTMGGPLVGEYFDIVERIAKEVVKSVSIPVGVKVTTEIGFPRIVELGRKLQNAGVKYMEIFNFAPTIAPPDIYNRGKSLWPYVDTNPFVAGCGAWLRPACYKNVAAIAKFVPGMEIAASGGIMTPENVVEVMMLGAGIAEYCTGILMEGRSLIRRTTEFLERFMDEQGYNSVAEFTGLGVQYIKPSNKIEFNPGRVKAEVDPAKCKGSGICMDHVCVAMVKENGKAKVIPEACDGCGLCVDNCPNGAIRLKLLD